MRVGDELYYPLPDPTGTSLTLVDANGHEAGYILYDPLGRTLTSTVSAELTEALAGQGALADPATGLVHLGNGRFYDPSLGRPLQPNPVGGPPTVPQALNRYAATSLGPPGVGAATINGIDFTSPSAWLGLAANVSLAVAGQKAVQSGRLVVEGPLEVIQEAFEIGTGKSVIGGYSIIPAVERAGIFRLRTRGFTGVIDELAEGNGFVFTRFNRTVSTEGLDVVHYRSGTLLREAKLTSAALSLGATFLVDIGVELFGTATGTGRWGNPYLTTDQKIRQARNVIISDLLFTGGLLLVTTNPYIAIPAAFIWTMVAEPFVLENLFPSAYEENRNLAPLQIN
jgi:hypothetical protein